jgi:hypothetical protein
MEISKATALMGTIQVTLSPCIGGRAIMHDNCSDPAAAYIDAELTATWSIDSRLLKGVTRIIENDDSLVLHTKNSISTGGTKTEPIDMHWFSRTLAQAGTDIEVPYDVWAMLKAIAKAKVTPGHHTPFSPGIIATFDDRDGTACVTAPNVSLTAFHFTGVQIDRDIICDAAWGKLEALGGKRDIAFTLQPDGEKNIIASKEGAFVEAGNKSARIVKNFLNNTARTFFSNGHATCIPANAWAAVCKEQPECIGIKIECGVLTLETAKKVFTCSIDAPDMQENLIQHSALPAVCKIGKASLITNGRLYGIHKPALLVIGSMYDSMTETTQLSRREYLSGQCEALRTKPELKERVAL